MAREARAVAETEDVQVMAQSDENMADAYEYDTDLGEGWGKRFVGAENEEAAKPIGKLKYEKARESENQTAEPETKKLKRKAPEGKKVGIAS